MGLQAETHGHPTSEPAFDFALLYAGNRRRLRAMFHVRVDDEDPDDMLHDLFLRLMERDAKGSLCSVDIDRYLSKSAKNLIVGKYASFSRKCRSKSLSIDEKVDALISASSPSSAQHNFLEARSDLRQVEIILGRCPAKWREAFSMHRFDGLSYEDIATKLNLSVGAVEKRIAKVLVKLRKGLPGS